MVIFTLHSGREVMTIGKDAEVGGESASPKMIFLPSTLSTNGKIRRLIVNTELENVTLSLWENVNGSSWRRRVRMPVTGEHQGAMKLNYTVFQGEMMAVESGGGLPINGKASKECRGNITAVDRICSCLDAILVDNTSGIFDVADDEFDWNVLESIQTRRWFINLPFSIEIEPEIPGKFRREGGLATFTFPSPCCSICYFPLSTVIR
jgi:hypothetical protein